MPPADPDLSHVFPLLEAKVHDVLAELNRWCSVHWPNHGAIVSEGFRSTARQVALYQQGRNSDGKIVDPSAVVTYKDGTDNPSNHQSCLAVDVVGRTPNGNETWDCPPAFWDYLGHLARSAGLVWGGDWKMRDLPHCEWPSSDRATYAKAKAWKAAKGLR